MEHNKHKSSQSKENMAFGANPFGYQNNIEEPERNWFFHLKSTWKLLKKTPLIRGVSNYGYYSLCLGLLVFIYYKYSKTLLLENGVVKSAIINIAPSSNANAVFADTSSALNLCRRFKQVAKQEERKFGIPAAVSLTLSLYFSKAGSAKAFLDGNNLFGIKCEENTLKEGALGNVSENGCCFVKFENVWTSFRAHSILLASGQYGKLAELEGKSNAKWLEILADKGYFSSSDKSMVLELLKLSEYALAE